MAALTGLGMLGTVAEAGLLHFRGAYHDPAMFLPVTLPPVGAGLLLNMALGRTRQGSLVHPLVAAPDRRCSDWPASASIPWASPATWAAGATGAELLNGPPLPAPPSFTGLALAGLAALGLLEDHPDA